VFYADEDYRLSRSHCLPDSAEHDYCRSSLVPHDHVHLCKTIKKAIDAVWPFFLGKITDSDDGLSA
jgi:hypothetical protein